MAVDLVAEVIGNVIEGVFEMVVHGSRGWGLFWRIIIFFVLIPLTLFVLFVHLTGGI